MNFTIRQMNTPYMPVRQRKTHAAAWLARSGGNLLVNGGTEDMRTSLLLHELNLQDGNSIVLTSSRFTEEALIEAAAFGELNRRLIVCSENHPNYDPLCGIGFTAAAAFFSETAEALGHHERSAISGYYNAVVELFRSLHPDVPLSLHRLYTFCGRTAQELVELAAEVDADLYTDLLESAAGGKPFRDLLRQIHRELAGFSSSAASGLSLVTAAAAAQPTIFCIRPSGDPQLTARLLTAELSAALAQDFHLLLCDSRLLHDRKFAERFAAKKTEWGTAALLTGNIIAYPEAEALLGGFSRQIHLLDGDVSGADLQKCLSALGSYQHFMETESISNPMKLPFVPSFKQAVGKNITQYERARVLYEEVMYDQAVLFSPGSGLLVTPNLCV